MGNRNAYVPAFLWLLLITALSVMPGVQLPSFSLFATDKLAHAMVYGILTWLMLRAYRRSRNNRTLSWKEWIFPVLSTGYGVLMECVQYAFIPGRFYEYDDMLANAFGAFVGWICFQLYQKRIISSRI